MSVITGHRMDASDDRGMMPQKMVHILLFDKTGQNRHTAFHHALNQIKSAQYTVETVDTEALFFRQQGYHPVDIVAIAVCPTEHEYPALIQKTCAYYDLIPMIALLEKEDSALTESLIESGASEIVIQDSLTPEILSRTLSQALARSRKEKARIQAIQQERDSLSGKNILSERLRLMTAAAEYSPIAIQIVDANWNIEYINPGFTRLMGYTLEELRQGQIMALSPELTDTQTYQMFLETVNAGNPWHGEFFNRTREQKVFLDSTLVQPVFDENHQLTWYLIFKENISERKATEQHIRYHSALIENISDAIISGDPDGRIVSWNTAAEELYGWKSSEAIGKELITLIQPEFLDTSATDITEALISGRHWRGDVITYARDNTRVYVTAALTTLVDAEGHRAGMVAILRDIQDRIQTEVSLREAEHFARSVVNALTKYIAILDETGTIIALNDIWRTFIKSQEIPRELASEGRDYLQTLDLVGFSPVKDSMDELKKGLAEVMQGEKRLFNMRYISAGIEKRWYSMSITSFHSYGSRHVVIAHEDVTYSVQVEEQLQQLNNFLLTLNRLITTTIATLDTRAVLDIACFELANAFNAPHVIAAMQDETGEQYRVMAEYHTGKKTSLLNQPPPETHDLLLEYLYRYKIPLISSRAQDDASVTMDKFLKESNARSMMLIPLFINETLTGTISVNFKDEHLFSEEEVILAASVGQAISKPLENTLLHQRLTGHMSHLETLVENRTEQLSRLNKRVSAILNNTSDGIVLTYSDNTIENANQAFERQFGYDPDGAFGKSILHIAEPGFRDIMSEAVRMARETGIEQRVQLRALRQDGSGFDADVAIARMDNDVSSVVCSIRDITRLKEVERIKDRFISMVSHELRTPTTSLVLSSNTLRTHYDRMSEIQRQTVIERMQRQSQVLAELIEGILDLSHIEVRTEVKNTAEVDIQKVIKLLINEFQPALTNRSQSLDALIDPLMPVLHGEEMDIERIWRNLIGNAVKYTPENGAIKIRAGQIKNAADAPTFISSTLRADILPWQTWKGTCLVGQVEDSGHGIPEQDLQHLFTRFYRGWAAASNVPGTGLGLSLVRELLRLYEGDIHVVSEVNTGSIFSFWVPIHEE